MKSAVTNQNGNISNKCTLNKVIHTLRCAGSLWKSESDILLSDDKFVFHGREILAHEWSDHNSIADVVPA